MSETPPTFESLVRLILPWVGAVLVAVFAWKAGIRLIDLIVSYL